jgi:hypothetical protein
MLNWFALVSIARRQELLLDAFAARKSKAFAGSQTPFAIFVKKLQESLTRMEAFDVVTVTQGMDGKLPPSYGARFLSHIIHRFETKQFSVTPSPATSSALSCCRRV